MSSSKAERQVNYTTLSSSSSSSNPKFDHVDPSWLCSGIDGPLSPYEWQLQTDTTAAGQQDTTLVEDQPQAVHDQRQTSHNSRSLLHTTPDGQPGSRDVPPPQSRTTDGVYRCSECHLVFQKRHLLKYVSPSSCRDDLTLTQYQVDTSGSISLPTSAHTSDVTSASVRGETSTATSWQSTPQMHCSRVTWFVLTRDASMQKEEAKYARGRTIWRDTFGLSMKEAHRLRMPCVASCLVSRDVCPKHIDEISCFYSRGGRVMRVE